MQFSLVIVQSSGRMQELPVSRPRLVVGRKDDCQIRIPISHVSREHCEFKSDGERFTIRDLGSSNGTYVNGERVQEQQLAAGDLVGVGPAVFVVKVDGKPESIDPADAYARGAAPAPVAAAQAPKARPQAPTSSKAQHRPVAKPATKDESDFDLGSSPLSDSSVSDFDFDFLDEDDEDSKKL